MDTSGRYIPRRTARIPWWLLTLAFLLCIWMMVTLKVSGVLLSIGVAGLLLIATRRPDGLEIEAIVASIQLSAEDLADVISDFDRFCTSPDVQSLEDRTLLRPALMDRDTQVPEIATFHEDVANAQRFLHRLPARLAGELSVKQAEKLLMITDERVAALRESWLSARRAARDIGPN
ncbi:hypothetical protein [Corynebacterium sp. H130]|uniref:hypothetical protein n=1 Tax=Corynebacterium sp. H130 TaxID=3133444 RepID=UPI003099F184